MIATHSPTILHFLFLPIYPPPHHLPTVTVTELWLDRVITWDSFASLLRPEPRGDKHTDAATAVNSFEPFYLIASLCNNARTTDTTSNGSDSGKLPDALPSTSPAANNATDRQIDYVGNPSEVALLRFCNGLRAVQPTRDSHRTVFEIPFNSAHKYHLVVAADVNATTVDGECRYYTLMKGAPELVIKRCSHYLLKVRRSRGRWGGVVRTWAAVVDQPARFCMLLQSCCSPPPPPRPAGRAPANERCLSRRLYRGVQALCIAGPARPRLCLQAFFRASQRGL